MSLDDVHAQTQLTPSVEQLTLEDQAQGLRRINQECPNDQYLTMGNWMSSKTSILFENVQLVGHPEGEYHVLLEDGIVKRISTSRIKGAFEVVDCKDKWLAPSLIDWHVHSKLNALALHRIDMKTAQTAHEALDMVADALKNPKYDQFELVGVNMRNGVWPDGEAMCRINLDKLSSKRPIYLFWNGYHSICSNSIGLERVGHPAEGDGILVEQEAFEATRKLSAVTDDVLDDWIIEEAKTASRLGVTEIVELENSHNIADWQRRYRKGFRALRVHVGFYDQHLDDPIKLGLKTGDAVPDTNGLITVGPYKIVTDGSLGSQTAYCHEPYPGTEDYGIFPYQPKTLAEMARRGREHGFKLAIHAIGDEANSLTFKTLAEGPNPLPGSTIEHAQLLDFADLPLFKKLGLIASVQPQHMVDDRETCAKFWPGREHRAWAFRSIVDAGIPIKLGSDCPVAPMQPWDAIAVCITRAAVGDSPMCAEQIIDLETAWAASTSNGQTHIRKDDRADLVLLSTDPLKCNAAGLRAMKVVGTMLGGQWTYRRK